MTDKKSPQDNNRKPLKEHDVRWRKSFPVYDSVPIGDRIDTNNETRGTGPRAPNTIKDGGKGKK